jgi:ribosomal protein L37AE/L43A
MLKAFSQTLTKREITESMVDTWDEVLKPYTWDQIKEAGYQALGELSYFPKPVEIVQRIKSKQNDDETETFLMRNFGSCEECGKSNCTVIKEPPKTGVWQCRQCYTGLSTPEIQARFKAIRKLIYSGISESEGEMAPKTPDVEASTETQQ